MKSPIKALLRQDCTKPIFHGLQLCYLFLISLDRFWSKLFVIASKYRYQPNRCLLTKNAALEFAREGIVANAIAPAVTITPSVTGAFKQVNPYDPKKAEMKFAQGNPSKRLGIPEEVTRVVIFLLSEDCSYVNGQTIDIDGGKSNSYETPCVRIVVIDLREKL
jgi:D-alanyl-D-alanine dipeptidase